MPKYYPDSASAFTSSFMAAFQPGLNSAISQYTKNKEIATDRLADNWTKAKSVYETNQKKNAQYMADASSMMQSVEVPTGMDPQKIETYLSSLIRFHGGNSLKAVEYYQNQVAAGAIQTTTSLAEETGKVLSATNSNAQLPTVQKVADTQTDAMLEEATGLSVLETDPVESTEEKVGTPPVEVAATPTDATSNIYGLNDLSGVEKREVGVFGTLKEALFTGRSSGDLMQDSLFQFKKNLQDAGELDLYNTIASGEQDGTPLTGLDGVIIDFKKMAAYKKGGDSMKVPNLGTIKSKAGWNAVNAGITSGLFTPAPDYLTAFNSLESTFTNSLPKGLPPLEELLNEVNNSADAKKYLAVYENLTPDEKDSMGSAWITDLTDISTAILSLDKDETGQLDSRGLFDTLDDAIGKKDKTPEDVVAMEQYIRGPFYMGLTKILATNTDQTTQERISTLNLAEARINAVNSDGKFDPFLEKIAMEKDNVLGTETSVAEAKVLSDDSLKWVKNSNGVYIQTSLRSSVVNNKRIYTDSNGEKVNSDDIAVMPENHMEKRAGIITTLSPQFKLLQDGSQDLNELVTSARQIQDLIDANPKLVTAPTTMKVVGAVSRVANEWTAVMSLASQLTDGDLGDGQLDGQMQKLEQAISASEKSNIGKVLDEASNFAILQGKIVLSTYRLGRLEGQSGQAMSNKDFDRLISTFNSTKEGVFETQLRDYAQSKDDSLRTSYNKLMASASISNWEKSSGGVPFGLDDSGIFNPANVRKDMILPDAQRGYDFFIAGDAGPTTKEEPVAPKEAAAGNRSFKIVNGVVVKKTEDDQ